WEQTSDTEAEFVVVLEEVECDEIVVPENPMVTQSECVDGEPTEPTIMLPEDGAIMYVADPEGPYEPGQEVTVTATLTEGHVWGELPEGWEQVSDFEAIYVVQLEDIDCDVLVLPEDPMVTQSKCVHGEPTEPMIVLPEDGVVTYVADPEGPYEPGQEVTITAELAVGHGWGELPESWNQIGHLKAEFIVQLDDIECEKPMKPKPERPKPEPPKLAATGPTGSGAMIGSALFIAAGAMLMLVRRRLIDLR
ncbi:hypothetical protein, partial [Myceligenerans halotolerans]